MIYSLIPIIFLAINPMLYDSSTIFRAFIITLATSIYCLINSINFFQYKIYFILFSIILSFYFISSIINTQSYADFLLGAHGRAFGFLTLLGLFLIVFISADNIATSNKKFINFCYLTLILALIYGSFQAAGYDFFEYALNYKGIRLTFANPNFSSAFLAIMAMIPLSFLFSGNLKLRIFHACTYLWTIYLIFQTESSQGFVLVLLGTILYSILYFFDRKLFKTATIASFLVVTVIVLCVFIYSSNISTRLEQSFQILGRLEHWRISLAVWNDHKMFGVGIENLGKYSGQYLSKDSSSAWGGYVYPDKAHNGILDHFANGGLIVGLSWTMFIVFISYSAIRIQKSEKNIVSKEQARALACMWFIYIGQHLISTDQIALAVIGMFVAGAIMGLRFKSNVRQND